MFTSLRLFPLQLKNAIQLTKTLSYNYSIFPKWASFANNSKEIGKKIDSQTFFLSPPTMNDAIKYKKNARRQIISPHQKHVSRHIYSYHCNRSASLQLNLQTQNLLNLSQHPTELLLECQDNLIYHTVNRIDLFFYTLVAYYNTGLHPQRGKTYLQNGKGRVNKDKQSITQACHSSFFTSFIDESADDGKPRVLSHSILDHTHFLQNLNSTVELPAFVNRFDQILEEDMHCRRELLKVVRKVAKGEINPIQGLKNFFLIMQDVFSDINDLTKNASNANSVKRFFKVKRFIKTSPNLFRKVLSIVHQYTFKGKWNPTTKAISPDYIQLLLRMSKQEKQSYKRLSTIEKNEFYLQKIASLQQEILENDHAQQVSLRSVAL